MYSKCLLNRVTHYNQTKYNMVIEFLSTRSFCNFIVFMMFFYTF